MKRLVALFLTLALMLSVFPASVFAVETQDFIISDTFVYDYMRNEDGIFGELILQFISFDEAGEALYWIPGTFETNSTVNTNLGAVTLSDTQETARWEVGNTYEVSYGEGKTFKVEVLPSYIDRIEINDCSFCVYDEATGKYDYAPTCTIYYTDGSEEVSRGIYVEYYGDWDAYDQQLELVDNQEAEPWVLGGSYEVTGTIAGFSDTFRVNVVCAEAISVDPIYMLEGSGWLNSYWNSETQTMDKWMTYNVFPQNITITMTDGTYATGNPYDLDRSIEYFLSWSSEQSYENPWGAGENTAYIYLGDLTAEYQVIIRENPVESVDIHDLSVVEESFGWMEGDFFYYDVSPVATITLKDGTVIEDYYLELDEDKYWIEWDSYIQYSEHWTAGNSYEITGSLLGVTDTFTVTVTESPIQSIEIADTSVMAEADGWHTGEFFYYDPEITATITLKDGTVLHQNYIELEGGMCYIDVNLDIQHQENWTVGNSYTVTGSLLGASDTFRVTVTPGPVESIEIQDVSVMEYTNGWYSGDLFIYFPELTATITLKDGTVLQQSYLELNDKYYSIEYNTSAQYEEPWTAGNTYSVTASLLGVSDTFNVTVTQSPVKSINVADMTIIEGDGDYDEGTVTYYIYNVDADVTLQDDTVIHVADKNWVEIDGENYYFNIRTETQYRDPWLPGNTYPVEVRLLGAEDTMNVYIQPTPVQSVTFRDLVLYQGLDSYSDSDRDTYDFVAQVESVTMKDGSQPEEILGDGIVYDGKEYWASHQGWEMQWDESWTVGNTYQVTGYLLGVESVFNVTIAENPVRELKLVTAPTQKEVLVGAYPNLKGAVIRIVYKDGTYEDIIFNEDFTGGYERGFYSQKLDTNIMFYGVEAFQTAGKQYAELELLGKTCQIPYTVKENKMKSLILTENTDKSITVSVLNSDNTGFDMKLKDMCFVYREDEGTYIGGVFTDKGTFYCAVFADDTSFALALIFDEERCAISNAIGASEWFEVMKKAQDHPLYYVSVIDGLAKSYDGTLTAENIDTVIEVAGSLEDIFYTGESGEDSNGYYEILSGEAVRQAVKKHFAVGTVDLSLSVYYDAQTDTYKHYDYIMGMGQVMTICPDKVSYSGGIWTFSSDVEVAPGEKMNIQMKMNSRMQITGFCLGSGSLFADVKTDNWQYSAAEYALENNLMAGKGTDNYGRVNFDPNSSITREEFVQVLYNAEGKPAYENDKVFPDVKNAWYKDAVLWANEQNIANGLGDGSFGIGKNITRQDLAVMLYKYAALKGLDITSQDGLIDQYADGSKVSGYAKFAMNWAVKNGVLSGKGTAGKPLSTFRLDPAGTATRAECAAMLRNFMTAFGL